MQPKVQKFTIDSILGGLSPASHFAGKGQVRAMLGIDPAQPIDDADGVYSTIASGLPRPAASEKFSGTQIAAAPLWIVTNPKNASVFVLDARGSAYTIDAAFTTVSPISDAGELSNGKGNGMEYYDNYIYASKNTTIARIGPLNGTIAIDGDYWVTTLSKTALVDTTYPTSFKNSIEFPNHFLKKHTDGRLYIADVVGNQGMIHFIQTTKTTVEGDTNNGSTYNALDLPFGYWPTAIESYGTDIAVASYDGSAANVNQSHAKISFWDTTSASPDKVIDKEFPDPLISGLRNVNGTLYAVSGSFNSRGFRISRFIGGYSFEEVHYSETGELPFGGAIDAVLNRLLVGSHTHVPESDGCVYSVGLQKGALSNGVFNTMRSTGGTSSTSVTAVCVADNTELGFNVPIIGWTQAGDGSTGVSHGLDKQGTSYSAAPSVIWYEMVRPGLPFKIRRVRIPFAQAMADGMNLEVYLYLDDGTAVHKFEDVNYTRYGTKKAASLRPQGLTGDHNFWLGTRNTGSVLFVPNLPIIIEWEYIATDD